MQLSQERKHITMPAMYAPLRYAGPTQAALAPAHAGGRYGNQSDGDEKIN